MKFATSIILSLMVVISYLVNGYFFTEKPKAKDNYLPKAHDAIAKKIEPPVRAGYVPFNYSGTKEGALVQADTGETFPGLDEDSDFVRELKAKPISRVYTEYGYISPEKLRVEGNVLGRAMLKRPDGKRVKALIVDYKGQLYDGELGFPCFLSSDTKKALGLKVSYF